MTKMLIGSIISILFFLFSNYLIISTSMVVEGDSRGWQSLFLLILIIGGIFVLSCIFTLPFIWSPVFSHGITLKIILSTVFAIIIPVAVGIFAMKIGAGEFKSILGISIIVLLEVIWMVFLIWQTQIYNESTFPFKNLIFISATILLFTLSFILSNYFINKVNKLILLPVSEQYDTEYKLKKKRYVFPDFDFWYIGKVKSTDYLGDTLVKKEADYSFEWLARSFKNRDDKKAVYYAIDRSYLGNEINNIDINISDTIQSRFIFDWVEEGKSFKIMPAQALDINQRIMIYADRIPGEPITAKYGQIISPQNFKGKNQIIIFPDFCLIYFNDFDESEEDRVVFNFESTIGSWQGSSFNFYNGQFNTSKFELQDKKYTLYFNEYRNGNELVTLKNREFVVGID